MLEYFSDSQLKDTNYFDLLLQDEPPIAEVSDPFLEAMDRLDARKEAIFAELGSIDRINRALYFQDTGIDILYQDSFRSYASFTPPPIDEDPDINLLW
jgi:hypothetical protein